MIGCNMQSGARFCFLVWWNVAANTHRGSSAPSQFGRARHASPGARGEWRGGVTVHTAVRRSGSSSRSSFRSTSALSVGPSPGAFTAFPRSFTAFSCSFHVLFTAFPLSSHCLSTVFPPPFHCLSTVPRCSHSLIPPLSSELGSSSSPSAQGLTRTARRLPPHHPRQEPPAAHGAGAAARKTSPPPLPSPRPLGHWAVLHRWIAFIVHLVISCYLDLSHLIAFILCRVRTGHRRDDGCRRGAHFLLSLTFHCLAAAFP